MKYFSPAICHNSLITAIVFLIFTPHLLAQEIESRAYSNLPISMNFLILGYAGTSGGLAFDTAAPVKDPKLQTSSTVAAYARSIELWGQSAKFDVIVPYTRLSGSAVYMDEKVTREINNFSDPSFRLSVNFYGAPALSPKDFRRYQQDLIIGGSLQVIAPFGEYNKNRLVNIGTNRWAIKPQLGMSKSLGRWTLELSTAATLFTDNNDFYGNSTRSQDPLYSTQGYVIYSIGANIWASFDATYFTGGRTTIDDIHNNDRQKNWRVGGTFSFPLNPQNSIKLYGSNGVSARTGNNFDLFGIAWQHRWGASQGTSD